MSKPIKKILVILLLLIVLPLGYMFYSQFASIDEYEQNIRSAYLSQLETILFSINQYSEDVLRNWINQSEISQENINRLIKENKSLISIVEIDSSLVDFQISKIDADVFDLGKAIRSNSYLFQRLRNYQKNNYQKLGSIDLDSSKKLIIYANSNDSFSGFIIDKKQFITEKLVPKINSIPAHKFSIVILDFKGNIINEGNSLKNKIDFMKNLWLFPDMKLGIILKGESVDELTKEKQESSLIILLLLLVVVILLSFAGYSNIKKEFELIKMKSDFVDNVSHELRTPLSLINLYSETLSMGRINNDEKKSEYYKIIHQESERLSQLINKILNFSKIENGKSTYNLIKKNLNEIVEQVYGLYSLQLMEKGFELKLNLADTNLFGHFDEAAIKEALINLLDNAVKYSFDNKEITISTGKENKKIFLAIADKGIGISKQNQRKIFEKFFRVSEGDVHNAKGTGIGLTIVMHIINEHNGNIEVESKESFGSTFKLSFPVINQEE